MGAEATVVVGVMALDVLDSAAWFTAPGSPRGKDLRRTRRAHPHPASDATTTSDISVDANAAGICRSLSD